MFASNPVPVLPARPGKKPQAAFSLIEFMIAMAIGMVMITASFVVYRQNLSDFQRQEQTNDMLESARAALYFLSEDLKMAGFFGNITDAGTIDDSDTNLTIVQDCGTATSPDTWAFHDRTPLFYLPTASVATATATFPCINVSESEFLANTDVLAIKRVANVPVTTYTTNMVYLRASSANGTLFKQVAGTPVPGGSDTIWPYQVNVYYIRNYANTAGDGIPSLYRKTLQLSGGGIRMETESGGIGEGVQLFRIQFGVDTNTDGLADYYTATPVAVDYANVVAVRVHLLVRSNRTLAKYTNSKTYTLGDISYTAPGDGYLRKVFTTTIYTRNIINTRELSS